MKPHLMKKNLYYWLSLKKLHKYQGKIRNSPLIKFTLNLRLFVFLWNWISVKMSVKMMCIIEEEKQIRDNNKARLHHTGCLYRIYLLIMAGMKKQILNRDWEGDTVQQFESHPKFWKLSCDIKIDFSFILIFGVYS